MSGWELADEAEAFTSNMRERLIAVHRSMDNWAVDFIAALKRVAPLCDCHVGSGEGAWNEVHEPACVHHRWADVHDPAGKSVDKP